MFNVYDGNGNGPEQKYISFSEEENWLNDEFSEECAKFFKFYAIIDKPDVYILEHENKWIGFSEFGLYLHCSEPLKSEAM